MDGSPIILELIGTFGMVAALIAYALITKGILTARSLAYQLLNIVGGFALIYYSYEKTAWATVALNTTWTAVALYGLYVIYMKFRASNKRA